MSVCGCVCVIVVFCFLSQRAGKGSSEACCSGRKDNIVPTKHIGSSHPCTTPSPGDPLLAFMGIHEHVLIPSDTHINNTKQNFKK